MAGTDPYGQPTWADGDPVNLAVDLTRAADSISTGAYRIGTKAEREAVTAYPGMEWWQTTDNTLWRYTTAWRRADVSTSAYTQDHADWTIANAGVTLLPTGLVLLALKLVGRSSGSASWTVGRRVLGRVSPAVAPPQPIPGAAIVRHSSKWVNQPVEMATNGQLSLDNNETVTVNATAQLAVTLAWQLP